MIRRASILCFSTAAISVAFLFVVAYQTQQREQEFERIGREIREQHEAVIVLDAEWAYLNRPDRLQQLSTRYLELVPTTPDRMIRIRDLPMRPPPPAPLPATSDSQAVPGRGVR